MKSKQMSVSKETVVMRRWESETWKGIVHSGRTAPHTNNSEANVI